MGMREGRMPLHLYHRPHQVTNLHFLKLLRDQLTFYKAVMEPTCTYLYIELDQHAILTLHIKLLKIKANVLAIN